MSLKQEDPHVRFLNAITKNNRKVMEDLTKELLREELISERQIASGFEGLTNLGEDVFASITEGKKQRKIQDAQFEWTMLPSPLMSLLVIFQKKTFQWEAETN